MQALKGLGLEERPVYFVSKALTEAQKGHVAIGLESLAVVWTLEKFPHFLYASNFILETDQNPLEAILSRSLNQATARLQRILIRPFSHHFTVGYFPGLTNQLTDCLFLLGGQRDTIKLPKLHLYQNTKQLSARSDSPNQLRLATQEDDELQHTITQGWQSTIKEAPNSLQPYWTIQIELTVEDGLVSKGSRIVIPNKKHEAVFKADI